MQGRTPTPLQTPQSVLMGNSSFADGGTRARRGTARTVVAEAFGAIELKVWRTGSPHRFILVYYDLICCLCRAYALFVCVPVFRDRTGQCVVGGRCQTLPPITETGFYPQWCMFKV